MSLHATDEQVMRLALHAAQQSLAEGHLPVGAVIVHRGAVIATGRNQIDRKQSDLAHAELEAISLVQSFLFAHAKECDIYTTLEPCMMCFGAIVHFHFRRLIVGAPDRLVGALSLVPHSPYYRRRAPAITANMLADESRALVARYVAQTGLRPHLLDSMQ